jgi:hypothetical protein
MPDERKGKQDARSSCVVSRRLQVNDRALDVVRRTCASRVALMVAERVAVGVAGACTGAGWSWQAANSREALQAGRVPSS